MGKTLLRQRSTLSRSTANNQAELSKTKKKLSLETLSSVAIALTIEPDQTGTDGYALHREHIRQETTVID